MVERKEKTTEERKRDEERAREEIKKHFNMVLKWVLSIKKMLDYNINIKMIPHPKPTSHDYAILLRCEKIFEELEELEDLQPLITMFTERLEQFAKVELANVKYDKEKYVCIYIDIPQQTKEKLKGEVKHE